MLTLALAATVGACQAGPRPAALVAPPLTSTPQPADGIAEPPPSTLTAPSGPSPDPVGNGNGKKP
jgi:hypothetical protein